MAQHRVVSLVLAALLAAPPALRAEASAMIRGSLELRGVPLAGVELSLVNLDSGRLTSVLTGPQGAFEARVPPGLYSLAPRGYQVARGPRVVAAVVGAVALAALTVEGASAPWPASSLRLDHSPVGCLLEDDFNEIAARIEPPAKVAGARVHFRSSLETEFHYVEMLPDVGRFVACLPRPEREAAPVIYHVEAWTADGGRVRTPEVSSLVVREAADCPGDRRMAALCPCAVPVAVYAAGGVPGVPLGFSGVMGGTAGAITAGTTAAMVVGATTVGLLILMGENPPASPSR